jgi:hypothetical protein
MRSITKTIKYPALMLAVLIISQACHNYYKVLPGKKQTTQQTAQSLDSLHNETRYFILRSGSESYAMTKMMLSADQKTISCMLDTVSFNHKLHFNLGPKRKLQYKKHDKDDVAVLNEVHLFIPTDNSAQLGAYTLTLDKVQKIEVLVHDKKRTTDSYVIGAIG